MDFHLVPKLSPFVPKNDLKQGVSVLRKIYFGLTFYFKWLNLQVIRRTSQQTQLKQSLGVLFVLFILSACSSFQKPEKPLPPPPIQASFHVEDPQFDPGQAYFLEVLESGDGQEVTPGGQAQFTLPEDSTWTLCASQENKEACYIVVQPGLERQFESTLDPSLRQEVFTKLVDLSQLNLKREQIDTAQVVTQESQVEVVEKSTKLQKVVLRVKRRPKRALGQSTVSAKSIKRMPALAEADVIKAIQALPGVVASSDFSSKIYVRGGGADQNLFLFDNGVVYSPVHFFGLFSTFLVEGLDDVQFYKGGFSPEYGNRLSSVVDIRSRDGGGKPEDEDAWFHNNSIKVSTFATQLHTEGKQDEFSWLFAYRQTYIKEVLEVLNDFNLTDIDLDYRFTDLQGNIAWKPNDREKWMVSGYVGGDTLDFEVFKVTWGNEVYPVNYTNQLSNDWEMGATYAYSNFEQDFSLGEIIGFENSITTHTIKNRYLYTGMTDFTWLFGIEQKFTEADFTQVFKANDIESKDVGEYSLTSPFIQAQIRQGDWSIQPGLRLNYQDLLDEWTYEPRVSLTYFLSNSQKFDFHVGKYYQYVNSILFANFETINEFYYASKKVPGKTIDPSESILFSFGYSDKKFLDQYEITAETYYKTLNSLISFDPNSQPDSVIQSTDTKLGQFFEKGEGYSYGLELSFRQPNGTVFGGVSYSYGQSVMKENDEVFPANWDKPHSVKADLGLNWWGKAGESIWVHEKKGRYLRSSTGLAYTSGLPYTGVSGYYKTHGVDQGSGQNAGGPNPILDGNVATPLDGRNETRYPDYFRWDIKLIDMGRYNKWNFSWTILNITNNENVLTYQYNNTTNPPVRETTAQFPFFPLLFSFEYYF